MRVLLVGLPLFVERLKKDLEEFDSENKYYSLNTYYSKIDQFKAIFLIPFVDVVYSIGGTIDNSKVFDIALKLNKRVMMTWVGTDVLNAKKTKRINKLFLSKAEHYCEVSWIQDELKELNIDAKILNFFNFSSSKKNTVLKNERLQVLSYIGKGHEDNYGWTEIIGAAKQLPKVDFTIVGTDLNDGLPDNVKCVGWVETMDDYFEKCHCTIRYVKHDGLSGFVLESLYRGKHVLYSKPLANCIQISGVDSIVENITALVDKLEKDTLSINKKGVEFVKENFDKNKILSQLIDSFKK